MSLRSSLNEYTSSAKDKVGIYFEYLPSGTSIGINDKKEIRLSSLAKVPTVMATYKLIEQDKLTEDKLLVIQEQHRDSQFGSLWRKEPGDKITVSEAARLAIIESDNTAHNLLLANLPGGEIDKVYSSLDIPLNKSDGGYPIISAKSYSSILRSLYLSSYLSREYSNKILEIMTGTIYKDKVPALLPSSVKVAHKVGVYQRQPPAISAYSDCGIIYVPNRPYLVCMMIEGTENDAVRYMSETSKIIYDYVSTVKGGL
ncbi:MAG: serine hydrolase [Patescibacteria group bacterium]